MEAKKLKTSPSLTDIRSYNIFKGLTQEEALRVNMEMVCTRHGRGAVIYRQGDRLKGCYIVKHGVLKIYKTGHDGREQIIHFAKEGDLIAYRSVISEDLACTTAKVLNDAVLCYIPGQCLTGLVKSSPVFALDLMKLTCRELGEANKFITGIAQKTVRERLAEVLLLLMDTFDIDENNTLQVSLTREELANIVGTSPETAIRLLSEFKKENLIKLNGRDIILLDIPGLIKTGNIHV